MSTFLKGRMLLTTVKCDADFADSADPLAMLGYLHGVGTERKYRLFCLAILQLYAPHNPHELILKGIELARGAAEAVDRAVDYYGVALSLRESQSSFIASSGDILPASRFVDIVIDYLHALVSPTPFWSSWYQAAWRSAIAACDARAGYPDLDAPAYWNLTFDEIMIATQCGNYDEFDFDRYTRDPHSVAELLREIFSPHPCGTYGSARAWLDTKNDTIKMLASSINSTEHYDGMPILADALEEAGCVSDEILHHCRKYDRHVRGCWVLDLLLGNR